MNHNFDVENAKKYGMLEAVLISHFEFWIAKDKANEHNYYEGKYWVYNSAKSLVELFPYASEQQIKRALKHLRDENVLIAGGYNKNSYDHTLWYTFSDEYLQTVQNEPIDSSNLTNREFNSDQPIPDNITNIKEISKEKDELSQEEKLEHNFGVLWNEYPRKKGKAQAFKHYKGIVRANKLSNQQMLSAIRRYKEYLEEQKIQDQYIMHGSTFFCSGIYDYLGDEEDD